MNSFAPGPAPSDFHFPIDADQDRRIRERVGKRLVELSKRNHEAFKQLPGMRQMSDAQRLADYRAKDEAWWQNVTVRNPLEAWAYTLDYARLVRQEKRGQSIST